MHRQFPLRFAEPIGQSTPRGGAEVGAGIKAAIAISIALAVAWFLPQKDISLNLISGGAPVARVMAVAGLTAIGLWTSRKIGLSLAAINTRHTLLIGLGFSLALAVYCAGVDRLFQPIVPADFVKLMTTTPVFDRAFAFTSLAIYESVIYRLALGSIFSFLVGLIWRRADGSRPEGVYILGFGLAQLINVGVNMAHYMPWTPAAVLYVFLRYLMTGVAWGVFYRRYGFVTNEIAVTAVHGFYQPLVTFLLSAG